MNINRFIPSLRIYFIFALITGLQLQSFAQKIIKIEGKVQYQNTGYFAKYNYVWLKKGLNATSKAIDSVKIAQDGTYSLTLKINKPDFYQLDILKWQSVTFWADESLRISSRGSDTAQVKAKNTGFVNIECSGKTNKFINLLNYKQNHNQQLLNDILLESLNAQKNRSRDSVWYTYLREHNLYKKLLSQFDAEIKFTYDNTDDIPSKLYALSILNREQNASYLLTELNKIVALKGDYNEAVLMKKDIETSLAIIKKTQSGSPIPEIEYPTPNGNPLNIKSLKGKYLIVDFWASWCGPCRKSIPKLKHLYELYHEKGFDILSISIDTDNAAWKKAMAEEAMPWNQVLSPDKNKTMSDFNIKGVPTLFIVDPNGHIVEKFTGYSPQIDEILKLKLGVK